MLSLLSACSMARRYTRLIGLFAVVASIASASTEIIVGNTRVQALSPTLLRVEQKGPLGFENRTTFMVTNRNFTGMAITSGNATLEGTVLSTKAYDVLLRNATPGSFKVTSPSGRVLYDTELLSLDVTQKQNSLQWPAPLSKPSYAITDYPRFFVPDWGTVPIPDGMVVDPALKQTNGYDFRNNVDGDTYVFLGLDTSLEAWSHSRSEFIQLAGSCPLLPDYAYGTWFTYWHPYNETEAKDDLKHWDDLDLPLAVWGMDMNWRNTSDGQDRYYDHPNTQLFPNFTEWFEYLKAKNLRTYFNDHPFPVQDRGAGGGQTSPEEVLFRWKGLSEWMARGLTFWWFDRNWAFTMPPPFVELKEADYARASEMSWHGLDMVTWGSHVYYNAVSYFHQTHLQRTSDSFYSRPISLTKAFLPNWQDSSDHAENPAQHRFPIWWSGDGVSLQGSVQSMVDSGLYGFKPFVHSDCGGDDRKDAGDLMRWTAHCAFGTILRFHGADHRAWTYDTHTVNVVRSYLKCRYRLMPSLIAAGQQATQTGMPLAARGDFYWPEHAGSNTNLQYIFLNAILVAPIYDGSNSTKVWVPPGDWEDLWDGSIMTGPKNITTTQPLEKQPMWVNHNGSMLVLVDQPANRVEDQDWSSLTLEAFPSMDARRSVRTLYERNSAIKTDIIMSTDGQGNVSFNIGSGETNIEREWTIRVHLRPFQDASVTAGGKVPSVQVLQPRETSGYFPLAGSGSHPPPKAGPIIEVRFPKGTLARTVSIQIRDELIVV